MSLQPLSPELRDILQRALRTQYVILPAQTTQLDDNDNDETINEIIEKILGTRLHFEDTLLNTNNIPETSNTLKNENTTQNDDTASIIQRITDFIGLGSDENRTEQEKTSQNYKQLTKAQVLSLKLVLGLLASLLFITGLLTAVSGDYLNEIVKSLKEIFSRE